MQFFLLSFVLFSFILFSLVFEKKSMLLLQQHIIFTKCNKNKYNIHRHAAYTIL